MENLVFYLAIFSVAFLIDYSVYLLKSRLNDKDRIEIVVIVAVIVAVIVGVIVGRILNVIMDVITVVIVGVIAGRIPGVIFGVNLTESLATKYTKYTKSDSKQNKRIKKNYPKLSIVGIMRERKVNQKFQTIYLLLIATIVYVFASKFLNFAISNIFLIVLFGSVVLITLESLIFNYRINKGWYGSNESEAREIIDFIVKNSDDIDFTDGNNPKSIIKPEDIKQVVEELGIQIPGYPQPNEINQGWSEG